MRKFEAIGIHRAFPFFLIECQAFARDGSVSVSVFTRSEGNEKSDWNLNRESCMANVDSNASALKLED